MPGMGDGEGALGSLICDNGRSHLCGQGRWPWWQRPRALCAQTLETSPQREP